MVRHFEGRRTVPGVWFQSRLLMATREKGGQPTAKTRNPVLKTVQENTEEIQAFYQSKGIDTVFQLNPGNHFVQGIERTVAGIQWLLSR